MSPCQYHQPSMCLVGSLCRVLNHCHCIAQAHTNLENYSIIIITVKILKIGTPEIITIIVLQLEQLGFTLEYCVEKMQTE